MVIFVSSCTLSFARDGFEIRPQRGVVWKDFVGVNAHFLWFEQSKYKQQMAKLNELNLEWARVDIHWDRHEKRDGEFDFSLIDPLVHAMEQYHVKGLVYLVGSAPFVSSAPDDVPNKDQYPPKNAESFAQRMALLAQRYTSIEAWQIWNEQNTPAFWQPKENPLAYNELFKKSVKAIRAVDPNKKIVMGGMAYYSQMPYHQSALMLEAMRDLGAFKLGTTIAYHPYTLTPEGNKSEDLDFIHHAKTINEHLRIAGVNDIWATEWGWSSYSGPIEEQPIIGEEGQADYLLRRLALMSAMDYDKVFLFALSDLDSRATARDQGYGLLDLNGQPKASYKALNYFFKATGPELLPDTPPVTLTRPDGAISIGWKKPDGSKIWMIWAQKNGDASVNCTQQATLFDPLKQTKTTLKCNNGVIDVPVSKTLQLVKF